MSIPDEIAQVLGVQGLGNAASVLSRPAEEFGNDVGIIYKISVRICLLPLNCIKNAILL